MKHRSATPSVTPDGFIPGSTLDRRAGGDIAVRFASSSYNAETRTIQAVASTGARVRRWGIYEELAISAEAVDLARVAPGQVKLLDSHDQGSIDRILGSVTRAWIEAGNLMVEIRFADTEAGREAEARATGPDAPGLSVGYRVTTWTLTQVENDSEIWRADRWELLEVSLVAVPADPAALFRAAHTTTPETLETDDMRRNAQPADAPVATPITTAPTAAAPAQTDTRAAPATQPDHGAILRAERERSAAILDIAQRAGLIDQAAAAIADPAMTVEAFRARAFDGLLERQAAPASHVRGGLDETETRCLGMEEAVCRSINPVSMEGEWSERAAAFRDLSLVDMAAERLGVRRVGSSFGQREEVLRRAMHTTSDFPILLENAINRNLAQRYALALPTYRQIAVQDDFNDFRPHSTVTVGDFPLLQPIAEAGKIQFGTIGEKKETVAVVPYAIGLAISRQLLVNDNLRGLDRVIANYGQSVALFEEKTAYAVKALNSGAGPTLLEGSAAMFATARGNLAGSGGAITPTTVAAARQAMRGYKSIDGNELLFNAPSILLVGPAKETEAEQFVSTAITPATRAEVNVFQGRLTPVVSQMITGNAWELYTDPSVRANWRWGLLSGYTAPRVRMEEPFGTQGSQLSVEHDFGFGGIEWRAAYRNPGN